MNKKSSIMITPSDIENLLRFSIELTSVENYFLVIYL